MWISLKRKFEYQFFKAISNYVLISYYLDLYCIETSITTVYTFLRHKLGYNLISKMQIFVLLFLFRYACTWKILRFLGLSKIIIKLNQLMVEWVGVVNERGRAHNRRKPVFGGKISKVEVLTKYYQQRCLSNTSPSNKIVSACSLVNGPFKDL